MEANPPGGAGRLAELDALRGIAAINVLVLHFTTDFQQEFHPLHALGWTWGIGNYGVNLFFLISGFVILLSAERMKTAREFALSRFRRLYPPYWAAILLTCAILVLIPTPGITLTPTQVLRRLLPNLTMFQGWLNVASIDSVYWTLQAELSFYVIVAVLIAAGRLGLILPVMTGLVVLAIGDHLVATQPAVGAYAWLKRFLILDMAYLFTAGVVICRMRAGFKPVHAVILVLCALSPATAGYFPNSPPMDLLMFVLLSGLLWLCTSGRLRWIALRPLLFLGSISYSLYLTHHWVGLTLLGRADRAGMNPLLSLVLAMAACIAIATLMRRYVEQPSANWWRRPRAVAAGGTP